MALNVAWLSPPDGLDRVSQKVLIRWGFHTGTGISLLYREWSEIEKKLTACEHFSGLDCLSDARDQRSGRPDWLEMM